MPLGTYTGTLPTWVAGEDILAADLDSMTDALDALNSAWTAYAVAWTSGGTAPAIGNGLLEGRYTRVGKFVAVRARLVAGTTTTYGTGQYFLSLPVDAIAPSIPFACALLDNGTANKAAIAYVTSSLNSVAMVHTTSDVAATVPHTWANGDRIDICGVYEVA